MDRHIQERKSGKGGELDEKLSKDENLSSKEAFVLVAP